VLISKVFTKTVDAGTEDYVALESLVIWKQIDEEEQDQLEV
jgi:hypothetical protein